MKIVRLQASGIKRLVAVDITPDGGMNRIGGFNGEGKTSLLDTIAMAMGGASQIPMKPLRTGEEYGVIRIDTGELVVTRYFNDDGTTSLKVQSGDGATYDKGQAKLTDIIGAISFDPIKFADMNPSDQAVELRRLVPLAVDLDQLAAADKADTLARRDINRDGKAKIAQRDAINISGVIPEKPDRDAIVARLAGAAGVNTAIERERDRRSELERGRNVMLQTAQQDRGRAAEIRNEVDTLLARIETLKLAAADKDRDVEAMVARAEDRAAEIAALPPLDEAVDTAALSVELSKADADLALLARVAERARLDAEVEALRAKSDAFTTAMADRQALREKALSEAAMPVEGLSFGMVGDDMVVTFNGEPFAQSSRAEQIRVSMRIAMAANPKLRVMTIRDGSLLDERGFKLISEIAAEGDYQVFIETVGEGDESGIIIEDGRVKGAPDPERVPPMKRRKKAGEPEAAGEADNRAAEISRATSPIAGDMAQTAVEEPSDKVEATPAPTRSKPRAARPTAPIDLFGGK